MRAGDTDSTYIIRGGEKGRERLRLLARVMEPATRALLDRLEISEGMSCADVGCGGGDVTVELARRVGAQGRVSGFDYDPVSIDIARQEAAALGLTQIHYEVSDLLAGDLPHETYDVVYVRFLLTHLREPERALQCLKSMVAPGGMLVIEDIDLDGQFCYPPSKALDAFVDLYHTAASFGGADSNIGRRLPYMMEEAGLATVGLHVVQPAGLRGDVKLLAPITMEAIGDAVVTKGVAARTHISKIVEALYEIARDETTLMSAARVVQVWGQVR